MTQLRHYPLVEQKNLGCQSELPKIEIPKKSHAQRAAFRA
jgi:hypothetical protein